MQARSWEELARVAFDSARIDSAEWYCQQALETWQAYDKPWDIARTQLHLHAINQDPSASTEPLNLARDILNMHPKERADSIILFDACITMARAFRRAGQMDSAGIFLDKGGLFAGPYQDSIWAEHQANLAISRITLLESSGQSAAMPPYFKHLRDISSGPNPLSASVQIEINFISATYFLNKSQLDSAQVYAGQAERLIRQVYATGHPMLGSILSLRAHMYTVQGAFKKSLRNNLEVFDITKATVGENHPSLGQDYNNLGVNYAYLGEDIKALNALKNAYRIFQQDTSMQAFIANNIQNVGAMYDRLGMYDSALFFYRKALSAWEKLGGEASYPQRMAGLYHAFGTCRLSQDDLEAALAMTQKANVLYRELVPETHFIFGKVNLNLANIHQNLGNPDKALNLIRASIINNLANYGKGHPDLPIYYERLGEIFKSIGNLDSAIHYFNLSDDLFQEIYPPSHPHNLKSKLKLGRFWRVQGNPRKAAYYLDLAEKGLFLKKGEAGNIYRAGVMLERGR
ncbi:MAG: tetratricopeptide repeat protein, partial [Bacteroidota bacterium]